jgi:ribosome biogenesis GTPase A
MKELMNEMNAMNESITHSLTHSLTHSFNGYEKMKESNKMKQKNERNELIEVKNRIIPETLWLVCGMPNVGKSTLINKLIGRHGAGVAAKPGWTRGQTIYRLVDSTHSSSSSSHTKHHSKYKDLSTYLPGLGSMKPADVDSYFIPQSARKRTALLMDTPGLLIPQRGIHPEVGLKLGISPYIHTYTYIVCNKYCKVSNNWFLAPSP